MINDKTTELQDIIKIKFKNLNTLKQSLIHKSYKNIKHNSVTRVKFANCQISKI